MRRRAARDAPEAPAGALRDDSSPVEAAAAQESAAAAPTADAGLEAPAAPAAPASYFLVRILFLRLLGLVFLAAFLGALLQNIALLGSRGLVPACAAAGLPAAPPADLAELRLRLRALAERPSLFLLFGCSDDALAAVALAGSAGALVPLLRGALNVPLLLLLWVVQLSFVNLGSAWYAFGWETQLLETSLWAAVTLPLSPLSLRRVDAALAPSGVAFALIARMLAAKIYLGAGLIKIRGDECWRDVWGANCMLFHYETQPNPLPTSWFFHHTPGLFHSLETVTNHVVELLVPFLLAPFLPRVARLAAGFALLSFQAVLIGSGNLSFLNWLTMLPGLLSFDDRAVGFLFSRSMRAQAAGAALEARELGDSLWRALQWRRASAPAPAPAPAPASRLRLAGFVARSALAAAVFGAYTHLQAPIISNLLSSRQAMNRSFGAWHLSNTYGAACTLTLTLTLTRSTRQLT